jgi:hypothetical protein
MVNDLWVTTIENSAGCWIRISGQTWPFCMNQIFGKILPWCPQKLCIQKMSLMNSDFCQLLIRPISTYGLVAMNFWNQISALTRLWTDWLYRYLARFLGHKMSETGWGLNTRSEGHLLSFLTPTQTHVSNIHNDGYGHFGTDTCGVSNSLKNQVNKQVGAFDTITDSDKIITF